MKKKFSCLHRTLPDILHCTQLAATLHIKGTEKEVECSLAEVRPESAVKGMELSVPYGHFSGDGVSLNVPRQIIVSLLKCRPLLTSRGSLFIGSTITRGSHWGYRCRFIYGNNSHETKTCNSRGRIQTWHPQVTSQIILPTDQRQSFGLGFWTERCRKNTKVVYYLINTFV